jgi:hypothetical protein
MLPRTLDIHMEVYLLATEARKREEKSTTHSSRSDRTAHSSPQYEPKDSAT